MATAIAFPPGKHYLVLEYLILRVILVSESKCVEKVVGDGRENEKPLSVMWLTAASNQGHPTRI